MMQLPFKDRRSGLTAAGIIMILLGTLAGCGTLTMPFLFFAASRLPSASRDGGASLLFGAVAAVGVYAIIATALIWTGIGSIKRARWVRPMVLIFSALAMAGGAMAALNSLLTFSAVQRMSATFTQQVNRAATAPTTTPTAPGTTVTTTTTTRLTGPTWAPMFGVLVGIATMLLFGVGVPAVFFWFYRSNDTRLTLEHFDPYPRWTDGVPVPVLGITVTATLALLWAFTGWITPMLYAINRGSVTAFLLAGGHIVVAIALLPVILWTYLVQTRGWTLAVAVTILAGAILLAGVITGIATEQAAEQAVIISGDPALTETMRAAMDDMRWSQIISVVVMVSAALAYLLWCRRFFDRGQTAA